MVGRIWKKTIPPAPSLTTGPSWLKLHSAPQLQKLVLSALCTVRYMFTIFFRSKICPKNIFGRLTCCLNFYRSPSRKTRRAPQIWLSNCWQKGGRWVACLQVGPSVCICPCPPQPGISPPFPPFTCPSFYSSLLLLTKLTPHLHLCDFYFAACWILLYPSITCHRLSHTWKSKRWLD